MVFETIHCRPFGPFHDRTLQLAPGMNVIHGPNESGKSTLRAAVSVGLCGQKRGPGRSKVARQFDARHRPWDDGSEWAVGVVIRLADGRRVELLQDLARGVDSSARDADSHRDLSGSVMNAGAPDGSRWIGLSRETFENVACVRQAEILAILDDAGALQVDLQRAAATARSDQTARKAVELLSDFRRERVGTERSPTKPLRRSQAAVKSANEALDSARKRYDEHRRRGERIREMEDRKKVTETRLQTVQAILVETEAAAAERRYEEARELSRLFPRGEPVPPGRDEEEGLEGRLAGALSRWESAPEPQPPKGPSAEELRERIAESEKREAACRAVALEIELKNLRTRYEEAAALDDRFPDGAPRPLGGDHEELEQRVAVALESWRGSQAPKPLVGVSSDQIAAKIEASRAEEQARAAVHAEVEAHERRSVLEEARGLAELVSGAPERRPSEHEPVEREVGEALRRWDERPDNEPPSGSTEAFLTAELAEVDREVVDLAERRDIAGALLGRPSLFGIGVAVALLAVSGVTGSLAAWTVSAVVVVGGIWWFAKAVRERTAERQRRLEELTARRRELERAITVRRVDDQAYEKDRRRIERAEQMIRDAAAKIRLTSTSAAVEVESLREWMSARRKDREAFDALRSDRALLEQVTAGRPLADLEAECDELDRTAREAASIASADRLEAARRQPLSGSDWERRRRSAAADREKWNREFAERRAEEEAYEARVEQRKEKGRRLLDVARSAGLKPGNPEEAAGSLESWQSKQTERRREFDSRNEDWGRLQALLQGRTLDELSREVDERQGEWERVLGDASEESVVAVRAEASTPARRENMQRNEQSQRKRLGEALLDRQTQDRAYEEEVSRRARLARAVISAAKSAGVEAAEPEPAADAVREWIEERRRQQKEYERRREAWGRYREKTEGVTLAGLERRAKESAERAEQLLKGADNELAGELRKQGSAVVERMRDAVQEELDGLGSDLDESRGESRHLESTLPVLVEREEALEAAETERGRVRALDRVLATTIRFLKQAEERIHRDLAPILRSGVRKRLAGVTGGRYTDCRVDPRTLAVEVCGDRKRWRSAADLSRGTAEQIYLLLRVTLAEHLGRTDEQCPLILDDPTASSDTDRRDAVLDALFSIAADRQVVLFTHDPGARDWAETRLAGDSRHRVERLSADGIPA